MMWIKLALLCLYFYKSILHLTFFPLKNTIFAHILLIRTWPTLWVSHMSLWPHICGQPAVSHVSGHINQNIVLYNVNSREGIPWFSSPPYVPTSIFYKFNFYFNFLHLRQFWTHVSSVYDATNPLQQVQLLSQPAFNEHLYNLISKCVLLTLIQTTLV